MTSMVLLVVPLMVFLHIAQGELQLVTSESTTDNIEGAGSSSSSSNDVLVSIGQDVVLPCSKKKISGETVWLFGKLIISIQSKMYGVASKNIGIFKNSTGDYLTIEGVRPENLGRYKCTANSHVATHHLMLEPAPNVIVKQKVVYGELGSKVKLTCSFTGPDDTKVIWLKEEKPLPRHVMEQHGTELNLLLNPVKRSDNGTYFCRASSRAGNTNNTVDLFVTSHSSEASRSAPASSTAALAPTFLLSAITATLTKL